MKILLVILLIALALVGVWYFLAAGDDSGFIENVEVPDETAQGTSDPTGTYEGAVLGGGPEGGVLLAFDADDYEQALTSDKLVVLYFYANWCPICRAEFPRVQDVFNNEFRGENVIGFRVNFNDSETDTQEEELAREFGIVYQHSKIFLKNGEQVLKAPDEWQRERYVQEIGNAL
jgi:thiol-disulfide isomerase/thioredoxin